MGNNVELTPEAIDNAMKFLSVPWLTRKELWSLDMARGQPTADEAVMHKDEAGRCRSTIIQLSWLRAENARLGRELEEARALGKPWADDVPLRGERMPKNTGQVDFLIEYLLTVKKRFGNTAVTIEGLKWGAASLWSHVDLHARIDRLRAAVKSGQAIDAARSERPNSSDHLAELISYTQDIELCEFHHDLNTGGASDALRAQADAPTKEGAD